MRKIPSGAGARTCTWMTPSAPSQHDGAPPNVLGQANRRRWTAGSVSLAATSTSRESSAHWVPLRGAARCSRLRTTWPVRPRISPRGMCICASCEASSLRIACAATTCLKSRYCVGMLGYGEIPILNGYVHRPVFFSPGPQNFGAAWDFWRAKKRTYIYNIYTLRARARG